MSDISHLMGSDLSILSNGNFELAETSEEGQQRVLRRLLTNPAAMPFHLGFGAGLAAFIGQPINKAKISARITSQMRLERAVLAIPVPTVDVADSDNGVVAALIRYTDRSTGDTSQLDFNTGE